MRTPQFGQRINPVVGKRLTAEVPLQVIDDNIVDPAHSPVLGPLGLPPTLARRPLGRRP
ncbi:MAG TPA: hypothetical protein VMA73_09360 [Streptosporangiaceae bacterium]|nr:hypothetical protein [Streptosporangiaceae bacterium]